jgi:Tripartite tricarboxylate transporter TctA family
VLLKGEETMARFTSRVGNVMLLLLNLPLAPLWARVMVIPRSRVFGGILLLASVGAYSLNRSVIDLGLLFVVGSAGFLMRVFGIPLVPAGHGAHSRAGGGTPASPRLGDWPGRCHGAADSTHLCRAAGVERRHSGRTASPACPVAST